MSLVIAPEIGQDTEIVLSCPTLAFSGVHSVTNASNWYSGFDAEIGAFIGLTLHDTLVPTQFGSVVYGGTPPKNSSTELLAKSW